MEWIQTVTGRCRPDELGMTLIHEHLLVGFPGWQMDAIAPPFKRPEALARGVDVLQELRELGVATFVDPCPTDLGRDVEFMAEASQRSGMRIICTTGAYKEKEGLTYTFAALPVEEITEIYVKELTEDIGGTGIRAGLIKAATGAPAVTDYERKLLTAAGRAAVQVGCPVITHTDDARCGLDQIDIMTGEGLPAHRILVGHSDGRADHDYHRSLADRGAYVGFDRFGIEWMIPDEKRIESVVRMVRAGYTRSLLLSHDAICAGWLGRLILGGGEMVLRPDQLPVWGPSRIIKEILPELLRLGVSEQDFRTMMVENPRRYFAGDESPRA
jgi:phosphotriesterase-related protein